MNEITEAVSRPHARILNNGSSKPPGTYGVPNKKLDACNHFDQSVSTQPNIGLPMGQIPYEKSFPIFRRGWNTCTGATSLNSVTTSGLTHERRRIQFIMAVELQVNELAVDIEISKYKPATSRATMGREQCGERIGKFKCYITSTLLNSDTTI